MQEEVNEKTIALCINGGKISARILKAALLKALARMEQEKRNGKQKKMEKRAMQKAEKGAAKSHGKQSNLYLQLCVFSALHDSLQILRPAAAPIGVPPKSVFNGRCGMLIIHIRQQQAHHKKYSRHQQTQTSISASLAPITHAPV